jgi:hypothetical protein
MSVFHQAVATGRITPVDIANAGGSIRRALRTVKRLEAGERNTRTPYERTAQYRREVAVRLTAPAKRKGKTERQRGASA